MHNPKSDAHLRAKREECRNWRSLPKALGTLQKKPFLEVAFLCAQLCKAFLGSFQVQQYNDAAAAVMWNWLKLESTVFCANINEQKWKKCSKLHVQPVFCTINLRKSKTRIYSHFNSIKLMEEMK